MGSFDRKGHGQPHYEDRLAKARGLVPFKRNRWMAADAIVDQVYVDLCNGLTRSEIIQKFANCQYNGQEKSINTRTAVDYLAAATDRLKYDAEEKAEEMRANLFGKLMTVYADALKSKDRYNAIQAINTLMKLTGVAVDKPQTAIQINSDKENGVTINFGFKKDNVEGEA